MGSWRANPEIVAAGEFAKRFNKTHVVVFYRNEDGRLGGVSYGRDGAKCAEAGRILEYVGDDVDYAFERIINKQK